MDAINEDRETLRKIMHDLRGPLVNLKGFHAELDESVGRMVSIVEQCRDHLPHNASNSVDSIVNDDLLPILSHLYDSIDQLNNRVDLLETDITIRTE